MQVSVLPPEHDLQDPVQPSQVQPTRQPQSTPHGRPHVDQRRLDHERVLHDARQPRIAEPARGSRASFDFRAPRLPPTTCGSGQPSIPIAAAPADPQCAPRATATWPRRQAACAAMIRVRTRTDRPLGIRSASLSELPLDLHGEITDPCMGLPEPPQPQPPQPRQQLDRLAHAHCDPHLPRPGHPAPRQQQPQLLRPDSLRTQCLAQRSPLDTEDPQVPIPRRPLG